MIDRQLAKCLDPVAARVRQFWMWLAFGIVWLSATILGAFLLWKPAENWRPQTLALWLLFGAVALALVCAWIIWNVTRDYSRLARRIEAAYPDLGASLLTALEQKPTSQGSYGYLQQEVLRRAYLHSYQQPWNKVVPQSRLTTARIANVLGLMAFAAVLVGLFASKPILATVPPGLAFEDVKVIENPTYTVTVEPGTTEVERGTSLLVMARFQGPVPAEAMLVYQQETGEERRLAMSKSLRDPVFGGRILGVEQPLTYHVEFAEEASETYSVTVFEYPRLKQADARLEYPSYTNLEEKLVQDVRRISVVEGTSVTLLCRLNKPVEEARLVEEKQDTSLSLSKDPAEPLLYQATFTVDQSRRLRLHLTDADGRTNQNPPEFVINALPNRPPDLKLAFPSRDVQVSPVEELDVKATAWDDYGLARVGLSFSTAGNAIQDVTLGEGLPAKERVPVEHVLSLEAMNAEPDQLVSYYFWAEDIGPDGEVRRVSSDMYFAEVRHFEEIFRQGQQPTEEQMRQQREQQQQQGQQGSQNAREAERLAELQKQIINGTWKVIRRETRAEPTEKFADDVQLLLESQLSALEQTTALEENLQDEESLVHVDKVRQHMQEAIVELRQAVEGPTVNALHPALVAEQSAYQALLKLRAREHEVVRSNQQQQQQSQSQSARQSQNSRAQQQLQQLQLREDENRYETQRQANSLQSPEAQEQREDRQVLNRLRELSQRQSDLNDRIKELQSALEEAQTQAEREEIERRLKRLQDEQQQILRDTEELQQRMEQPENQERMAGEREQLQEARESARQSSEALREGQVSRAAADGTRAEREFRELQDDFQRRTSGQFTEEMREMQQQARELEQKEEELAEQLAEANRPPQNRSLRDDDEQQDVGEQIREQRQRIENLLDRMRQTVEEAEGSEPLLAEQLYDTIRNTRRQNPQTALENAERSFNRGLVEDAQDQERQAQEGVTQIRQGIDRAAESVLGDETEALRRAQQQLERLNRELGEEIARNQPNRQRQPGEQQPNGERQPGEQPNGEGQPGERQPGEQQPNGERQPGQQSNGERQPGERQPGQQPNGERQPGERQPSGQQPNGERQPGEQQPNGERQPGEQPNGQGQPGERQPGEQPNGQGQPGERQPGEQQPNGERQPGEQQPNGERQPGQRPSGLRGGDDRNLGPGGGGLERFLDNRENRQPLAPLAGEDFLEWSDRLRDVEEMLSDPKLRAEAARIRDRAKAIRKEVKRHSEPPNWDIVREMVSEPLAELQTRVASELLRRTSKEALVPIDRDPVPPKYEARVRKYYERLGAGK